MASSAPLDVLSARAVPIRVVRSAAAASVSVMLAVAGHKLGGGEVTPSLLLVSVFTLVFVVTLGLSARQLTAGQIVGLLLIGQAAVHAGCALGGAAATFGPAMVTAHLMATALTTVVLVRGEQAAWSLADRLGLRAIALVLAPGQGGLHLEPIMTVRPGRFVPVRAHLVGSRGLRGPPIGCA